MEAMPKIFTAYNLAIMLILLCPPQYAFAASPNEELQKTQKELEAQKERGKKLAEENRMLAAKYKKLNEQMVKTAADLQSSEAKLSAIEDKLRSMTLQINEKTEALNIRKKDLATMVQASLKLSQTPPEAIILMPGDMMDNMKASRALKMTVDSIKFQSGVIRKQMAELEAMKQSLTKNQEDANSERARLSEQRELLKTQIAEHSIIQKKLNAQQQEVRAKTQSLARKAKDLKDLIISLEREKELERKKQEDEIESDTSQPEGEKGQLRSFADAKGHIRVPAAGKLSQRFGESKLNETTKGIIITTRPGAQVTSPYDAEVLFTGPFMEYGSMIILRHSDGFHTLLAGMSKIDASVGDFLLEGEPIGAMGDDENNNRLYMELRSNNQPIDPAPWVRGLNK